MAKKKIGILTGGGDVPGLNAVIKSVTFDRANTNRADASGLPSGTTRTGKVG